MKKILFLLVFAALFACNKEPMPEIPADGRLMNFTQLNKHFENPPAEYRTAPFWVWNTEVSEKDIDRSLESFKEQGIGGVFLHPRYGLITEYLSDDWWKLVDYSLQKAEELDLKLWIYDENSFPSGFAGGHVAAQLPEANSEGVALAPYFANVLEIPDDLERVKHIFKKEGENWIEVSYENEMGKSGEYCLLDLNDYENSKWFGGYSYVDLLKPGVTDKFMEITMPGYEKTLGDEFGKRVPGVFTDEPNINTRDAGPIRYTPDLYEQFEKQWGYRLEPHLMSLITETGNWKKVRHNYQSTLLKLFIERWSKPWFEYTEENNLAWTGHYWEHGWPNPKEGPDNMAMYAWHQVPGIDMLFNAEEARPDQFGNIRNVKELSSVVNQFERHRALSETYGAAGWELTFEDMKRLGDWEFVLGVNLMNQHLSYMSLAGDRKHDFPQAFGPYSPYWGVYRYQADYFARLSLALSSGIQQNNILVIEPTTTGWMYYNPAAPENSEMVKMKEAFEGFLEQLEQFQVEYDLGSENIIANHGRIEGNGFIVNKADYDQVVLPPGLENIDGATYKLLQEFSENDGKVLQIGSNPRFVDGEEHDFGTLQQNENWRVIDLSDRNSFVQLAENEFVHFENPDSTGGNILHQRRMLQDGQLLFLTNFDKNEKGNAVVEMKGKSVLDLNPSDGKIEPYVFQNEKNYVKFEVPLHPAGSKLLFISNKRGETKEKSIKTYELIPSASETEITRINQNILTLDYVELSMGAFENEPMYFYSAANEIWQEHGFPDNPWVSSSQFKSELVDREPFPEGSGFRVNYPFFTDGEFSNENIQLVVERPWLYTVEVNGNEVSPVPGESWLDLDFHIFEIGPFVRQGKNEITVAASPFSIHAELQPVYLLGEFALTASEYGWKMENGYPLDFGAWNKQGLPFYGQVVAYSKNVEVKVESEYVITLNDWNGTVAEVLINGEHQGIIQAPPYELKVTLPYGKHDVEVRIAGSLKNTFGPHHNFTTPGIVTPWSFKFAPDSQPHGEQYDLLEYGLMEDFEIYRLE